MKIQRPAFHQNIHQTLPPHSGEVLCGLGSVPQRLPQYTLAQWTMATLRDSLQSITSMVLARELPQYALTRHTMMASEHMIMISVEEP